MNITIREYESRDALQAAEIWNEVVRDGMAFPQEDELSEEEADSFFLSQSSTGVAIGEDGRICGLYILHPNNIGRCGHICNASYAVASDKRGCGIGRALVIACMEKAKELRFTKLGVIPKGFRMPNGTYEDIIPHYISLS